MGLQSALSTALTGMNAAETTIDVAGNNVANANTVGFKQSKVNFATQFLQTQSIGSAPTDSRGGTNPRQVGLGVKVAEISPEFTQGTIEISSNPLDLAIQGEGFFIVQGSDGGKYYTRNGQFKTNSNNEIVTSTGQRVLGFGHDDNYNIRTSGDLEAIQIPLGQAAVAQATQNVYFDGKLDVTSDVGSIAEVIQSAILSDGKYEVPDDTTTAGTLGVPAETTTTTVGVASSGGLLAGTYSYRVAYVDVDGNVGPASEPVEVTVGGGAEVTLDNIPNPQSPDFPSIRIYRSSGGDYYAVGDVAAPASGPATFPDSLTTPSTSDTLNDDKLSSTDYTYYVTFYNASSNKESRPAALIGPVAADATTNPQIRLDNFPIPDPNVDPTDRFTSIRIYRNSSADRETFKLITPTSGIDPTKSFIDSMPDSDLSTVTEKLNREGPEISNTTLLTQLVSRSNAVYTNLFEKGTLSFTGTKGDQDVATRELEITDETTVGNLLTFMEESMGVVRTSDDPTFPSSGFSGYGGSVSGSRLQFVSNMGIENALSVGLSAFQLTPADGGATSSVVLPFSSVQEANGEGASTDFVVYDSLGTPINVRLTTVLEATNGAEATFRWIATSADNESNGGNNSTVVGTGLVKTDGSGKVFSGAEGDVSVRRDFTPAESPLVFTLNFAEVSGLDQSSNELSAGRQDGFPAGTLSSFIITETGKIQGVFSNGSSRDLGQIRMARFANNNGLEQVGDNLYAAGVNSGLPILGDPGANGIGNVTAGAVELSNSDIGKNLIELILASTQYRGGARVITSVQNLLDELLALGR